MDETQFIKPELLILVPVLNMIGKMIKSSHIKSNYIPFILGIFGVTFCLMYEFIQGVTTSFGPFLFNNVIQGILLASMSVYGHQMYCQHKKKND